MIELRHLKTLSALRDAGSLVEAADRVHLTQSALSHQIKDLEDRLNCSLFIRKTKPICFTSAGQRLLTLADEVLPMIRNTERDIARLAGGEAGRLNISIDCHSCFDWLMPTIDHFRQHWPEVEMDLSSGFTFQPLPALARGDLDLVITSDPEPRATITYIPLFSYESLLAVGKRHRLANKKYVHATDLESETVITYPVDQNRLDLFTRFLEPAGVEPHDTRTAELTLMILQLVASGRGVAALPNWALHEYLQRDYVAAKSLGERGVWCTLYAAIREDQKNSEFMVDFLDTAKQVSFSTLTGIRSA
ncbi:LysR family transcriptional regulator [Neptunomonas phycophila]|jgi:LysR family transcriptional regulator for metE and metH|uniref:HTH-type transcriptional regulator MetR n=1 Tax=Neptunomonas phycophila TaxID=1572645 RepID=A0ABT9ERN0_9GAMM|nr:MULTISPECIES: LysR family transcriptional regulator [Neptunomonas]MBT3146853.1 LysR family transcriptional regulator [Neptunomonas phycophila]MDN2661410.1 LysR family transcriptional regulator [Neptunomonas sp. CHC150]MDO6467700.1 LysR family transcriptional regulator [Neptunomonas phycophila]MDO6783688.1 LysR family transcriptional regulator [Neptunomonas phycophila]MDP2521718.1 LysR family transcriptional regulator [Neptunomonas phycophila]